MLDTWTHIRQRKFLLLVVLFLLLALLRVPTLWATGYVNAVNVRTLSAMDAFMPTDPHQTCAVPAREGPRFGVHTLARLERLASSSNMARRALARYYCLTGDLAQAAQAWADAYRHEPRNSVVAYYYAVTSYALGRTAHTAFDREISTFAVRKGHAVRSENPDAAIAWYDFALSVYPNIAAASSLAGIYRARGELDRARAVWEEVIARLSPGSPDGWIAKARLAELDRQWAEAARYYEEAARASDPAQAYSAYLAAGDRWKQAKQYDRAEAAYRAALALYPQPDRRVPAPGASGSGAQGLRSGRCLVPKGLEPCPLPLRSVLLPGHHCTRAKT